MHVNELSERHNELGIQLADVEATRPRMGRDAEHAARNAMLSGIISTAEGSAYRIPKTAVLNPVMVDAERQRRLCDGVPRSGPVCIQSSRWCPRCSFYAKQLCPFRSGLSISP